MQIEQPQKQARFIPSVSGHWIQSFAGNQAMNWKEAGH
jgi:hypothetical protein